MSRAQHLFSDYDLRQVLEAQAKKLVEEIDSYPPNKLLNTSPEDLAGYFEEKYRVEPLEILEEDLRAEVRDEKVDVSQHRDRYIRDRSQPFYIDGTVTTVELPFRGDPELLKCAGSRRSMSPPRAVIDANVLKFSVSQTSPDADLARREIQQWVGEVQKGASWLREILDPWNDQLKEKAAKRIAERRQKLFRDHEYAEELGIPLKRRNDEATTYVPDEIRRKPPPTPPPASEKPYRPEPTLPEDEYEHILDILKKTAVMLERSPRAFRDMGEEQLRDQFLVPLNSHYEGQATGETFNMGGKTDILVRVEDRTVFIAECKIWRGPKAFSKALDQLLGYATWRDTKTAVLVFNRNKNLGGVLGKVPAAIEQHPNFKRFLRSEAQTEFRFLLASNEDANREIIVTVLVFDVPGSGDSTSSL